MTGQLIDLAAERRARDPYLRRRQEAMRFHPAGRWLAEQEAGLAADRPPLASASLTLVR
jgi:hypothetical protein